MPSIATVHTTDCDRVLNFGSVSKRKSTMTKSKKAAAQAKPKALDVEEALAELSKPHQRIVGELSAKVHARPEKVKFSATVQPGGGVAVASDMANKVFDGLALCDALGTSSEAFGQRLVMQLRDVGSEIKNDNNMAAGLAAGLGFVQGVAPQNEIEGALATQMFAVHCLMMSSARRVESSERMDACKLWLDQVNRLGRTFTAQVEALQKLRGGGRQLVEVKHTHIDARNSQNVIADTVKTGGGERTQSPGQPHAQGLEYQPGTPVEAMLCEDAVGEALPSPCGAR
ncbi:hypothetical protein ABI_13470 [Asticcacaulis biprosthecium C19]|uniref:Uncharacterized protein n=1 Tax=Asticcacaulis biprosthecium C19 TaxID=715226 RepID=F4QI42_9CAUL|nr:hypothetical protein [Asticcacaulis biprosthecium]EGF92909.1 hypothetical protein ABI_13470 [Asticcacaulis biprosthecium C19]